MSISISEELQAAIRRKGWSIKEAAERCGVRRSFLSRLLAGQPPPRKKKGHATAAGDERYRRLAERLALPDPERFIAAVVEEQRTEGRSPFQSLSVHHRKFSKHIYEFLKRRERRPMDLVLMCLQEVLEEDTAIDLCKRVDTLKESSWHQHRILRRPFIDRTYLGTPLENIPPTNLFSPRTSFFYRDIAYSLMAVDDPKTAVLRAEIAVILLDLANLVQAQQLYGKI